MGRTLSWRDLGRSFSDLVETFKKVSSAGVSGPTTVILTTSEGWSAGPDIYFTRYRNCTFHQKSKCISSELVNWLLQYLADVMCIKILLTTHKRGILCFNVSHNGGKLFCPPNISKLLSIICFKFLQANQNNEGRHYFRNCDFILWKSYPVYYDMMF